MQKQFFTFRDVRYYVFILSLFLAFFHIFSGQIPAQELRSPEDFIGYRMGTDYKLARCDKIVEYFRYIQKNSDRVNVREMGTTTEGRPFIFAEISSPETIIDIKQHMENQRKIADPRLIANKEEEKRLIENSKAVVFINCNLHSTEIGSSQMALELLYDLASGNSQQIREILKWTIIIIVPSANPDGTEMVIDWYEQSLGKPWEGSGMPWLYQKYAGHDNNRDWFMLNLKETQLETKVLYREWFPHIVVPIIDDYVGGKVRKLEYLPCFQRHRAVHAYYFNSKLRQKRAKEDMRNRFATPNT